MNYLPHTTIEEEIAELPVELRPAIENLRIQDRDLFDEVDEFEQPYRRSAIRKLAEFIAQGASARRAYLLAYMDAVTEHELGRQGLAASR